MTNIAFIHRGGDSMASYRYRAQIPAEQLSDDYTVSINEGTADVVVFSKPFPDDVELAKQCKHDGTKIIVDFCDDHFNHKDLGPIYHKMANLADQVVCNTKNMQGIIHKATGKDAYPIHDPYEQERCEPHAEGDHVLWFGHQRNLYEIVPYVNKIENLSVVTGPNKIVTGYIHWTPEAMKSELAFNNLVLLPAKDSYKSPNRLINAIMGGCFVISEAHKEFRQFAWIGHSWTGLKWAKEFKSDLNALVSAGQDYIEKHYSPRVIGDQWKAVI